MYCGKIALACNNKPTIEIVKTLLLYYFTDLEI